MDVGGLNFAYIGASCIDNQELLERAVDKCMWGKFYNSGQSRSSIEGILVHHTMVNRFTNMLSEKVNETLFLDDPMLDETNYGVINDPTQILNYNEIVNDAVSQGGVVTIGGYENTDEQGLGRFYEPTIIAKCHSGMRLQMNQTFGPVVGIQAVDSPGEAAKIINS